MIESERKPQSEHPAKVGVQINHDSRKSDPTLSVISEVACNKASKPPALFNAEVLCTKCGAIAKLIGRKALIQCNLSGLAVTALLDTGAQVSIIGRHWKERYLPDFAMRPLSEIIEEIDDLKVCAVNGEAIPFDGWIPIMINLPASEDPSLSINNLVLVSSLP